jgi:hypothetical protein
MEQRGFMAKSLTERIVDRKAREAQEVSFIGEKNMAMFLLHGDEMAKALADGCTIKAAHKTLREENNVLCA